MSKSTIEDKFVLARIGASLFTDIADSLLIIEDTGLHVDRILMEQPALTRWLDIVEESKNDGLLENLIDTMLSHYPNQPILLALKEELGKK